MILMTENKSQVEKFKEAARELQTDESEEAFDEKLKRVAKSKPVQSGQNREKPKQ